MELSNETLLDMYWHMLLARRLDERAWVLHRQGKIAFHISGIGHEATQVGAAFAIQKGKDYIAPYYRDLGMMLVLGLSPKDFVLGLMGKKGEPSSGARQMPSHWSIRNANVISQSSPVATQAPHASGIGLGIKMAGTDQVVLTSLGEGSTSQGEWYEALNWGAVHKLPVIYLVENNVYAISVRQEKQMAVPNVADRAKGFGMPGVVVDGTDFQAVYYAVKEAVDRARNGEGPTLVEAKTYRITPHSSDDDDRTYRSREEVEEHKQQDPLLLARDFLEGKDLLSEEHYVDLDTKAKEMVNEAVQYAESLPYPSPEEGAYPVFSEEVRNA